MNRVRAYPLQSIKRYLVASPSQLLAIIDRDVRSDLIIDVWGEFVRIAAPIHSGKCTAVDTLARIGSVARGQAMDEGGVHIGRLFRSIFLIDYFTNTAFRTELQHVLNCGEAVHNLQRAIHIGEIPVELGPRPGITLGGFLCTDTSREHPDGVEHHPHAARH